MRHIKFALATVLVLAGACATPRGDRPTEIDIAIGDVTETTAMVWLRAPEHNEATLQISGPGYQRSFDIALTADADGTAKLDLTGLPSATRFDVRGQVAGAYVDASFATAPTAHLAAPVTFLAGGDLAGQNVCRDAELGFPVFDAVATVAADFFVGLGDMIYADGRCDAQGRHGNRQSGGQLVPATDLAAFRRHWHYSFGDPAIRRLRRRMAWFAVWDDHEVSNDFGPQSTDLVPLGRHALIEQNPIRVTDERLYRSVRWGRHLELFLLDTRQYRDAKDAPDAASKTLLGRDQTKWLVSSFAASDATWQVVVSSVPLSIPTGWPPGAGRDGWASGDSPSGYEQALLALLHALHATGRRNWLWLSADVHFATAFRYRPFADDPQFVFHELVTGPLSAGLFPSQDFDQTLNPERLFFHGPDQVDPDISYDAARRFHNIGVIRIDARGTLTAEVIDSYGSVVGRMTLLPETFSAAPRH